MGIEMKQNAYEKFSECLDKRLNFRKAPFFEDIGNRIITSRQFLKMQAQRGDEPLLRVSILQANTEDNFPHELCRGGVLMEKTDEAIKIAREELLESKRALESLVNDMSAFRSSVGYG